MALDQLLRAENKHLLQPLDLQKHRKGLEDLVNRFVEFEAQDQDEIDMANPLKQQLAKNYSCRLQGGLLCKERLKLLFPSELLLSRLSDRQPWR